MEYNIKELLRYIKNKDIESFDKALEKYHININLNFYEQIARDDGDEYIVSYDEEFGNLFLDLEYPFDFLSVAIYYEDLDFCKYLVKKGAKVHKKNQLIRALFTDNVDIFQFIYSLYPKISLEEVLSAAAQTPALQIYKYLVEVRHADITKTKYWDKAVDVWCIVGRLDIDTGILQYLLDSGYFPDHKKLQRLFRLSKSAINRNAFDWLVKNCCKTAEDYQYALFVALSNGDSVKKILNLVELCSKHNVDFNKTPHGFEPVMFYIPNICDYCSYSIREKINFSKIKKKSKEKEEEEIRLLGVDDRLDTIEDTIEIARLPEDTIEIDRLDTIETDRLDTIDKIINHILVGGFDINKTRDSLGRNFIEYLLRNIFDKPKHLEYFYLFGLCRQYMNGFQQTPKCIENIPHDKGYDPNFYKNNS